jgi:hypothetical protein
MPFASPLLMPYFFSKRIGIALLSYRPAFRSKRPAQGGAAFHYNRGYFFSF